MIEMLTAIITTTTVAVFGILTYQSQEKWKMKQKVYLECLELVDRPIKKF